MRYRLHISYDGTAFHGWQKQFQPPAAARSPGITADLQHHDPSTHLGTLALGPSAIPNDDRIELRTVQGVVERAVFQIVRERAHVLGASRTDAGVHAAAQTGVFETRDDRLGPPDVRLADALNSRLPADVRIESCVRAPDAFDPISDCLSKGYRYRLFVGRGRPLWERRYVHHVHHELDPTAMRDAAAMLVGTHDFAAFAQQSHGRESTVRTIFACDIHAHAADPRRLDITVSGDGFLYNMVRIIAGTLVDIGRGRLTPSDVTHALESRDRSAAGPTLGPAGLCLEWIRYAEPIGVVGVIAGE